MHQELLVAVAKLRQLDHELCRLDGVTLVALSEQLKLCDRTIRRYLNIVRELGCDVVNAEKTHRAPARWRHRDKSKSLFTQKDR
jgi:hypothetical protein